MSSKPRTAASDTAGQGTGLPYVERRRFADVAHDEIRARIISGDFPMGMRLNEAQLAIDLGVSRAPVREAIRRLCASGVAVERPHQGAVVRTFDSRSLVDLYNVRASLESVAVRLAVRRGINTAPLRHLVEEMSNAAGSGRHADVARLELDFHAEICKASGNEVLVSLYQFLENQILMALALDDMGFLDLEEVSREHAPVIAAIESGDEEQAAKALEEHIMSTIGSVITRLGGSESDLLFQP